MPIFNNPRLRYVLPVIAAAVLLIIAATIVFLPVSRTTFAQAPGTGSINIRNGVNTDNLSIQRHRTSDGASSHDNARQRNGKAYNHLR